MSTSAKLPDSKMVSGLFTGRERATPAAPVVRTRRLRSETAASTEFEQVFLAPPHERIDAIRRGVPAAQLSLLAERMQVAKESLIAILRLSRATVNRKARDMQALSQDESERVLGLECLIGQVENMVRESGASQGFDAAVWVSNWLHAPLPALGNKPPAAFMDTVEGQKLVSGILAMGQSGAYA